MCEPALSELPFAAGFFAIEQFADENNHLQEWPYNHLSLFLRPLTLALSVPRPRSSAPLPRLYDLQFCVDRITQMKAYERGHLPARAALCAGFSCLRNSGSG